MRRIELQLQTGFMVALCLLACTALVVTPAVAGEAPWLHVEVVENGDETKVNINLPMAIARIALPAISEEIEQHVRIEAHDIEIGHSKLTIAQLKEMWRELRRSGDAELFSSRDGDETVEVFQRGDRLHINVTGDREEVKIEIPSEVVDTLLAGDGDKLDVVGALAELDRGFRGDLVRVFDGDTTVRVWID